mmetsp:Transcript_4344/g.7264  ORF Transcript_4344/g.7264 Transcript_4344/m.7264 type:complete len:250 (+) Transcript_4344:954-1703(+)
MAGFSAQFILQFIHAASLFDAHSFLLFLHLLLLYLEFIQLIPLVQNPRTNSFELASKYVLHPLRCPLFRVALNKLYGTERLGCLSTTIGALHHNGCFFPHLFWWQPRKTALEQEQSNFFELGSIPSLPILGQQINCVAAQFVSSRNQGGQVFEPSNASQSLAHSLCKLTRIANGKEGHFPSKPPHLTLDGRSDVHTRVTYKDSTCVLGNDKDNTLTEMGAEGVNFVDLPVNVCKVESKLLIFIQQDSLS